MYNSFAAVAAASYKSILYSLFRSAKQIEFHYPIAVTKNFCVLTNDEEFVAELLTDKKRASAQDIPMSGGWLHFICYMKF